MLTLYYLGDDTEQVNYEERPIHTLMGKDNENKSFPIVHTFMCSKQEWVFTFIVKHALPNLHPGTACARVNFMICDADPQETRSFDKVAGRGLSSSLTPKVCPNAWVGNCGWHKIDRNLINDSKYHSLIQKVRDSSIANRVEVDVVIRWLWYFIKHYETEQEISLAMDFLSFYLSEPDEMCRCGSISEPLRVELRDWITTKFESNGNMLFEALRDCMTLGNCTTAINEAFHKVIKHSRHGPRRNMDIAESASAINQLTKTSFISKSKKVAHAISSKPGKKNDQSDCVEELTLYSSDCLKNNFFSSVHYERFHYKEDEWFVKRSDRFDSTPQQELELPLEVCQVLFEDLIGDKDEKELTAKQRRELERVRNRLFGNSIGGKTIFFRLLLVIKLLI